MCTYVCKEKHVPFKFNGTQTGTVYKIEIYSNLIYQLS